MGEYEKIVAAVAWIRRQSALVPEIGIVLGSGLGDFVEELEGASWWEYTSIPHFPPTSVPGHQGRLWLGKSGGRNLAILQGRGHYYEGHDILAVVLPTRVLRQLGATKLLLTNAAGGINRKLSPGDLMIIADHLNLMGVNPLRGENDDRLGPRFPDMSRVYDKGLRKVLAVSLRHVGRPVKSGVYAALSGPSYETPAEIQMLQSIGADAVGMSTVPEAISARHMGMQVAAISCITNLASGLSSGPLSHDGVTETAARAKKDFLNLLRQVIPRL